MDVLEDLDDFSKLTHGPGEVDDFILRFCGWGAEGRDEVSRLSSSRFRDRAQGGEILVPRRLRRRTVQGLVQVAHLPAEFPPENLGFLILAISRHPILARHDALRGTHTDARRTGRKVGTPKSSKTFERERLVRAGFSVTEKFHPSLSSRPRDRSPPENWTQRTRLLTRFCAFRDPSSGTLTSAEAHRPSQADPTLSDRSRVFQPALRSTPGASRARPEPFSLG